MENSYPLSVCNKQFHRLFIIIKRSHALIHCLALAILVYYRASFLFNDPKTRSTPVAPWLIVFSSELLLCFIWILSRASRWSPVSRKVFPENLPEDDKLPSVDVFIFTVDPNKEPTEDVMNTVLSAMALDYPAAKLHVYLSDDGGAPVTLHGMRKAWRFARSWLPFCRRFGIKTRCPKTYFSEDNQSCSNDEFIAERNKIEDEYKKFRDGLSDEGWLGESPSSSRDHPPYIEVIRESCHEEVQQDQTQMPLLVYVSREKKPSRPHHFKAGAINTLLRVSGVVSNSPYILILDCDMYCNDPASARHAMCFHLDPKISPSLAFVQFPQKFRALSANDIYDSEIRAVFKLCWPSLDGLRGPIMSGTNFYIKRKSIYGNTIPKELRDLQTSFGLSNEFIKSLHEDSKARSMMNDSEVSSTLTKETNNILASCTYEDHTKWGTEVGFRYQSVLEDYLTGFTLHCKGWTSVYLDPSRPQFLGSPVTNLNDFLIQGTRWSSGLVGVGISSFCPLIYGTMRMSILQSMCYADLALQPLINSLSLWSLATVPQICTLSGISLYPKVSDPFFVVFLFIFTSSLSAHLFEVLITGGSVRIMVNELRIWMIKSVTSHFYGSLDAIMEKLGMRQASFVPTSKVEDSEQVKRYQMGVFDFQTSPLFLVPMVTILLLNMASFLMGIGRIIVAGNWEDVVAQAFISFYILVMNYPIIEGMAMRKDKGRIQPFITLLSAIFSIILLCLGSIFFIY